MSAQFYLCLNVSNNLCLCNTHILLNVHVCVFGKIIVCRERFPDRGKRLSVRAKAFFSVL